MTPTLADNRGAALISGGRVLTPAGIVSADVLLKEGRITAIDEGKHRGAEAETVIDASGLLVLPGFIDIQINGGFGHDFTAHPDTIWAVGARLPSTGVTAFLPTIITSPPATIAEARQVLAAGPPTGYAGAVPLGLHLEGPMLSPRRCGAHDPTHIRAPRPDIIDHWSPADGVRVATIAPELDGAGLIVEMLTQRGVVVSLGHSECSYDIAVDAIRRGASVGTHLYNAMSPLHHRDPGLAGALLDEASVTAGIIVDGLHVHPAAVRLAWTAKQPDGLVLVSDAMAATGIGHGTFDLGSTTVRVGLSGPRTPNGELAGSTLTLDEAIRNLISFTGCSVVEAVASATATPARILGDSSRGIIELGARGDLAIVDADLAVRATLMAGRVCFADPHPHLSIEVHEPQACRR